MSEPLIQRLRRGLADSRSRHRKAWAQEVVDNEIPLENLLTLFHADKWTSQRFMWLIGDICELNPELVKRYLPILFSMRDEIEYSGMHRSVAKWLLLTNVPEEIESEAVEQLFQWLENEDGCIASKSYSAKALFELVKQGRASCERLESALSGQSRSGTRAYGARMAKLLDRVRRL